MLSLRRRLIAMQVRVRRCLGCFVASFVARA